MKKQIILLATLLMTGVALKAQVGIGTNDPKSTLEIVGETTASVADGVLVPRFSATDLGGKDTAYGAPQNGALVFVTGGTGASPKTVDVTAQGFYYFDAAADKWVAVGGGGGIGTEVDGIIGNEVLNATTDRGLIRSGAGTAVSPYTLGLPNGTTAGEVMQWDGTKWVVATSSVTEVDGIIGNEVLNATTDRGLIRSGAGTAVSPYTLGLPNGTTAGEVMQWDGTKWVVATSSVAEVDGIIGNEVVGPFNNTVVPNPLKLEGTGTAVNPYSLDIKPAGIQASHLAQMGASNGQVLQWNGTTWVPSSPSAGVFNVTAEIAASYTVLANDGFVKINVNAPGAVLTLPTSGIPVGKIVYVSHNGSMGMDISPTPRNTSFPTIQAGTSGALIYLGGTEWDWVAGY